MTTAGPTNSIDTSDCRSLYQVKVALGTDGTPSVTSVEMLTRGGVRISADGIETRRFDLPKQFESFMAALKADGLLNEWTTWVVQAAATTLQHLPEAVSLAINIDPRELAAPGFLLTLENGIPERERARVTVELTEQSPLPDDSASKTLIQHLVRAGFRLSIDDFCKIPKTTSLAPPDEERAHSHVYYLATLPVSEVKVDMSCAQTITREVGNPVEKLMHWICSLPTFMDDLKVVVEGVESDFPLDFLESYFGNECVLFQGYAYSQNIDLQGVLSHPALPRHQVVETLQPPAHP